MFSIEIAAALANSTDPFPVDFDNAWTWIGYSRKDTGLETLFSSFVVEEDYVRLKPEFRSELHYAGRADCSGNLSEIGFVAQIRIRIWHERHIGEHTFEGFLGSSRRPCRW